jgi:hypothetical protein
MIDKVFEGSVSAWFEKRSGGSGFGFVNYDGGGARVDRVYFCDSDIICDNAGRRGFAKIVGNLVHFRLEKYEYKGLPSVKAVGITSVFPTDVEDVAAHREISVVHNLRPRAVFLRRSSGEDLILPVGNVAEPFLEQFYSLKIGQRVWHGVQPPAAGMRLWAATHAEFYQEDF